MFELESLNEIVTPLKFAQNSLKIGVYEKEEPMDNNTSIKKKCLPIKYYLMSY
jgi:hypothetical protein